MAVHTITQKPRQVNTWMEKSLESISNPYSESCRLRAVILTGSSEEAFNLLAGIAPANVIPGTYFATKDEIARFYGVSGEYLQGVFQRHGVTVRKMPEDVEKLGCRFELNAHFREYGMRQTRSAGGDYLYTTADNGRRVSVSVKPNDTVYSARIFLAAAVLMQAPRVAAENVTGKVLEALRRSVYMERAEMIRRAASDRTREERANGFKSSVDPVSERAAQEDTPQMEIHEIKMNNNGDITLSPDLFAHVIRTAVRDGVAEGVKAGVAAALAEAGSAPSREKAEPKRKGGLQPKLKKPTNWDVVWRKWKNGEITAIEGARQTGMSYGSFRNYASGKGRFDD